MDPYADRKTAVYVAKLAVESERYEEAVDIMKRVALMNEELSIEERNLITAAYKNVIALRRSSWRVLATAECREASKGDSRKVEQSKEYVKKVEAEINEICEEIKSVLTDHVLPSCPDVPEHHAFYYKMIGDSFRYRAELKYGREREALAQEAFEAYDKAARIAEKKLKAVDPIRLGLALNFSVFYYEICNSVETASDMAEKAYNEAMSELDTLSGQARTDSERIVHLLRDNLTRWATAHAEITGKAGSGVVTE